MRELTAGGAGNARRLRRGLVGVALALGLALAACGSSSSSSSSGGASSSAPASSSGSGDIASALLTPSDLPSGFTATPVQASSTDVAGQSIKTATTTLTNGDASRVITMTIALTPTPDLAKAVYEGGAGAIGSQLQGAQTSSLSVGDQATKGTGTISGAPAVIVIFTQGRAEVTMAFVSKNPGDTVPDDFVQSSAQKVADKLKSIA